VRDTAGLEVPVVRVEAVGLVDPLLGFSGMKGLGLIELVTHQVGLPERKQGSVFTFG
jgi:hypothetical protein